MIAHILPGMDMTGKTSRDAATSRSPHTSNFRGEIPMHQTLQRLFQYKAWANDELLTALASLGDSSPMTGLAIKALSHTYVVDQIFAAHLRRVDHSYASANLSEMPDLADLAVDMRRCDQAYIAYVTGLDAAKLVERINFTFTDGAPARMSREEMLMHVITHGVGHRGQISALMLLNGMTPTKDGFTTYLHHVEARPSELTNHAHHFG
jgi:uncharacterized damage-inducible protein DinB